MTRSNALRIEIAPALRNLKPKRPSIAPFRKCRCWLKIVKGPQTPEAQRKKEGVLLFWKKSKNLCSLAGACRKQRKQFFFEKKNQKTFIRWFTRIQSSKSFLVLFFKKELLAAFLFTLAAPPPPPTAQAGI
jgi:hypothetical protein